MQRLHTSLVTFAAVAALALAGCHRAHATEQHELPKYAATTPLRADTQTTREFVAQVRAIQHIEVRALEKGYLEQTFVDEGQQVTKGTKLFQIMPRLYQAEVQKATAEADLLELEYRNTKLLADKNIVSPSELALSKAKLKKATAQVGLAAAERSLTVLRAPFDGITGRLQARLGSLVAEGDLLTTLSDNSTVWVYFNVSEAEYLRYKTQPKKEQPSTVRLMMANGELFDQPGKIETIEADFNSETGNVAFRAAFKNPDGLLRHGETGKIVMTDTLPKALVIPQKATFDVLDKRFVFVVDEQNVAHAREITVAVELPQTYVVASGLTEQDRILLDGLRKVRDGATVAIDLAPPSVVMKHLEVPSELPRSHAMNTNTFLRRPVLAIVLSVVLVFVGALSMRTRPVSQFPEIAPPRVIVSLAFPGASADVLVQSSLITLERAINGVPGMSYMVSDATSAGEATIQVIFELDADPNQAVVNVKNRVDQVMSRLPPLVQLEGVVVNRVQSSMLMYVNLYSLDKKTDQKFLYNFANVNLLPELSRVPGIAQAQILGSRQYAMRIWLNTDRMRAYKVSSADVMKAIDDQSVIGRPGRLGQASGKTSQAIEYVLTSAGRFNKPEQYEAIIIRANADGEILRLKDIATVELGSEFFDIYSNIDGHPSAAIVLKQTYGSNAGDVIADVKAKLGELKRTSFPPGMDYEVSYDVSGFLDASIEKVVHTLVEAFVLVALVVFLFLGDWRSTLIPTLAVPVSLVGTFSFMQIFGLSINLITLFALVLAIGIVVDNAIVVVEAVHAKMAEEGCSPYTAVHKVMDEISGAVVAITLLMTAVFVPVAFMSGPVGIFYRQFSITMAASIVLSGLVALTLTPVLCAMLLKNTHGQARRRTPVDWLLDAFNKAFDRGTGVYTAVLRRIVDRRLVTFAMLAVFSLGIGLVNRVLPAGFVPNEDQGMVYAIIQTPPGTTLEHTNDVSRQLQEISKSVEGVTSVSSLAGYEVLTEGRGSNAGTCLINLAPWSKRHHSSTQIIEEIEEKARNIGAIIEFFEPTPVPGYGAASGFALRLLDKTNGTDYHEFDRVNQAFMAELGKRKELTGLFTLFAANYPQYELSIDNDLAAQKGVSIKAAMDNLDILIGSTYEQGFIRFNTFFKVYTQAAPEHRRLPKDILEMYVKNEKGEMVPYSAFMTMKKTEGPNEITRYNMYNSSAIRGGPAAGYTSGDALRAVREVAATTLPRGYDIAWEGLSFDESRRGNEAFYIFVVVLGFVYLVLAAQYESFLLPFAVLLSLPCGVFGSLFLLKVFGLANDIYAQVGLVMLVGLLGKNAVLIVEFAVQRRNAGDDIVVAAIEGAKVRFRPILMTSFAFIAGLLPLVVATGPGAVGNRTIGSSALGGMLFGTVFGVVLVPGLYYVFAKLSDGKKLVRDEDLEPLTEEHHAPLATEASSEAGHV